MKGYNRSNIKVTYVGEPVFYINERKQTITCKLEALLQVPETEWLVDGPSMNIKDIAETVTVKCHEGDTFDVERGKKIALAEAKSAIYLSAIREVSKQAERLQFLLNASNDFIEKGYACMACNDEYVDELSIPAHPKYIKDIKPIKEGKIAAHIK